MKGGCRKLRDGEFNEGIFRFKMKRIAKSGACCMIGKEHRRSWAENLKEKTTWES